MNRCPCQSRKSCTVPSSSKPAGGMARESRAIITLRVTRAPGCGCFRSGARSSGTCTAYSLKARHMLHKARNVYAELHALSNFSFLRGASQPEELVMRAKGLGYRALALTDECSL